MDFQPGTRTEGGYLALPKDGSGPGVLVLHAWWGLNAFFVQLCDRLAEQGFVTLAPDLFAGATGSSVEEAEMLVSKMDMEATGAQLFQALDALQQHPAVTTPQIGVLGFSLGAAWALELATRRPEAVTAAIIFYGLGDADFTPARAAYQCHFAANDTWEPLEQARQMEAAMRAAGREAVLYVYPDVGHWFMEDNQPQAYNVEAAHLAWERAVAFLQDHLLQE